MHRFVKFAKRTLRVIEADISKARDAYSIERVVEAALAEARPCDLVRVVLCGEHFFGEKPDTAALTARFGSRFYYFEAKDETRLRISASDYEGDRSLKGEFIRLVMQDLSLSDSDKEEIIDCGLAALLGEGEI